MFEAFKKLKLASAFLGHPAAEGGGRLTAGDIFGDLDVAKLETFGGDIDAVFDGPGVAQLYDNRYMPPPEELDVLLDLPGETLGYQLGLYLKRHGLTIAPPADIDFSDRVAYIRERVRMNHALIHVLTEYDASPRGELAVQSFFVGQLGNLASGTMLAAGLLQIIQDDPGQLGDVLLLVTEAFERGRTARPFLGMPWEELFPAPAAQIRELFGLTPRTSMLARLDLDQLRVDIATTSRPSPPPEPEPEPAYAYSFAAAPEPEPEPEPALSFGSGRKPKTRWAGLDLLSQAAAVDAPEPSPEPEPAPRRRSKPEPSPLARALSGESPLAGFSEAAAADPEPPPAPEPPRLDLRGPARREPPMIPDPPKAERAADAPTMSRRRGPPPPPPPREKPRADKPAEPDGYSETEDSDEDLPKPGDRDYF
ncbi:MAG: Coq4 family protein [Nannocystaceae bacterium]